MVKKLWNTVYYNFFKIEPCLALHRSIHDHLQRRHYIDWLSQIFCVPVPCSYMCVTFVANLKINFFFFFFVNKLHLALNLVPALPGCWHSKRGKRRHKRSRFLIPLHWTVSSGLNSKRPNRLNNDNNSAKTYVKYVRQDSFAVWASSSNTFHLMLSLRGGKISWPSRSSLVCVSQCTLNLSANSCWWRHYNMRSLATTILKNPAARHHEGICFLIG